MWNYRLCKHMGDGGYLVYDVREVYYKENGDVEFYSENCLSLYHVLDKEDTEAYAIGQIKFDVEKVFLNTFDKPVIDLDTLFKDPLVN